MPRRSLKDRLLMALAWTAVGLSIPMAAGAIHESITDARWEEVDRQWEIDDARRHSKIMGAFAELQMACGLTAAPAHE